VVELKSLLGATDCTLLQSDSSDTVDVAVHRVCSSELSTSL
jgi:hypothetical protein